MRTPIIRTGIMLIAMVCLAACAPTTPKNFSVTDAFQTSDAVKLSPYTRTIFSSGNF